ncbi:MAG TPA: threonine ammonia-lyase [Egibacteraceae bacterium]|nr:threonine ammonia-lyase [Egibacteraceae bacterium]
MTPELVSLDDIRDAAQRLAGVIQSTPVEPSRAASDAAGVRTLLKCEHLQRTGSFKLRGAYNRIARLGDAERSRGVVCASAGNHAQGVALSASLAQVAATVFMPAAAPLPKVQATRGYGAEVVLAGDSFDDAYEASQKWAAENGAVFVHPFDHRDVIAGQGTLGLEIVDEVPDVATVVVPVGGGGLIAGVATAVRALRPGCRVVGVQAAGAAAFPASLAAGQPCSLAQVSTIADGIAVRTPGALALAHVREHVDEVVTVSDEAIARAVLMLVERAKQVVEPAGAAGLAAVLERAGLLVEPVVVLLAGGNVDPLLLVRIVQSGMFEEGRYFAFRTRLADRPGALSRLLAVLAEAGANILAVEHHRLGTRLGVLEVEVQLEVETRGPDHIRRVVEALRGHDYPVA